MQKLLQIPKYFADTLEPSLQVLDLSHHQGLEKTASEAWDYIKSVKPKEGKRYILVIAMGAREYWGHNKNGDAFPEKDLIKCYKNFETTYDGEGKINGGALIFKHHKNKLREGHPWYGTVAKAFYNHRMHRVELLLEFWASRGAEAQELIDRVDRGEILSVSMGVHIPYDTCSICGNKAKKKEDYCEHLHVPTDEKGKPVSRGMLGQILRDGRVVCAINGNYDYNVHPNPLRFFDISVVFRPADPTGYMLKKVASFLDHEEDLPEIIGSAELFAKTAAHQEKTAYLRKLSAIDKIIKGLPIAAKEGDEFRAIKAYKPTLDRVVSKMETLPEDTLEDLSKYPMNKILSTLSHHGILLTTPEFISLVMRKLTGIKLDPAELRQLASLQGEIFEELSESDPEEIEELEKYSMFEEVSPDPEISALVEAFQESRDLSERGIVKKAASPMFGNLSPDVHDKQYPWGDNKAMLHSEYYTDPHTGTRYAVSQTAIDDAQWWDTLTRVVKALGTTALLGGIYAYLKGKKSPLSPVAGIAALALGAEQLKGLVVKDPTTGYLTAESGTPIPRPTMMMEKKAFIGKVKDRLQGLEREGNTRLMATMAPIAATSLLRKYYEDRLMSGTAGTYGTPAEEKLDTAGKWAYHHPVLTGGAGVIGSHYALNLGQGLKRRIFRR